MAGEQSSGRVVALEGLRGVAAVTVVLRHTFNAVAMPLSVREAAFQSPLALLLNGQGAVQLFFVLSGYVLAGSVARGSGPVGLSQFLIKRVFRIYPPYVIALLLTWAASFLYVVVPASVPVTRWYLTYAQVHLPVDQLLPSLLFPGPSYLQLPVGWTLRVEMIFSLLLPALYLLGRRVHWIVLLGLSAWLLVIDAGPVLRYSLDFCLGIAAYLERERLAAWIGRVPARWQLALVAGAAALFVSPLLLGWSVPRAGILMNGFDRSSLALMGLGSVALIVFAVHVPMLNRWLSVRPVVFLGKISYSVYLLHFTVMILWGRWVIDASVAATYLSLMGPVLAISILLSAAFYSWVERPAVLAGNRVCKWLARHFAAAPLQSKLPGS